MSENQITRVESMWGSPILDEGFTNIPNLIIHNYVKVGLTHSEFCIVNIILTFKHDTRDPFPSQEKIARIFFGDKYKPDTSERALRKHLKNIEDKGLMYVGYRNNEQGRASSVYNFQPLIEAVLEVANVEVKHEKELENVTWKHNTKGNGKKANSKTRGSKVAEQKVPVLAEQKVQVLQEQKVPQPQEQKVPTKKKSLKSQSKKKNNNKSQSVHELVLALEVSDTIKGYLETKEDGLTPHKLSVIELLYKENLVADDKIFEEKLEKVFAYNPAPNAFKKYLQTSLVNSKDEKPSLPKSSRSRSVRKEVLSEAVRKQMEAEANKVEEEPKKEQSLVVPAYKAKQKTFGELIAQMNDPIGRELLTQEEITQLKGMDEWKEPASV